MREKDFKSIHIDIKKGIYEINGENVSMVSHLELEFDKGKWSLFITKDEIYETATNNLME